MKHDIWTWHVICDGRTVSSRLTARHKIHTDNNQQNNYELLGIQIDRSK